MGAINQRQRGSSQSGSRQPAHVSSAYVGTTGSHEEREKATAGRLAYRFRPIFTTINHGSISAGARRSIPSERLHLLIVPRKRMSPRVLSFGLRREGPWALSPAPRQLTPSLGAFPIIGAFTTCRVVCIRIIPPLTSGVCWSNVESSTEHWV